MPENLNDSAATYKQNLKYTEDRTHPEGKPYSRKQRDAIAAAAGRAMLFNEDNPTKGRAFEASEVESALEDGWVESPLVHPNCPSVKNDDDELAALWLEVDRLKINPRPHHRSGKDKLMRAIAEASDG